MVQLYGTTDQSTLPDSIAKADKLMLAGAALAVVQGLVAAIGDLHRPVNAAFSLLSGVIVGAVWWWVAKACAEGRGGARLLATVFFALSTLGISSTLNGLYHFVTAALTVLDVLSWLVGLGVVLLLWQRDSSAFFESRRRFPR
ncbi:uncharacterized membrane protein (UPF0136 family) [Catenulispora sp. GP43]|uniref:hypothetical protein n=1 Tax=Catenulispora sp. GP43 TaxID=3156263 RepID=UPI003513F6D3